MEQVVLVPASVYNKNLKTQLVVQQEEPKYQTLPNPTYQFDSLKRQMNKKLFAREDFLVDKIMSCPCAKLSNSKILILDGVEIGVFRSDSAQQLRRLNADVRDI